MEQLNNYIKKKVKKERGILFKKQKGYILIKVGETWMFEHRIIAENILKRLLTRDETIHHRDLNKKNNNPSNLMLFNNQKEHSKYHIKLIKFPWKTNPMKRIEEELSILNIAKQINRNI